MAGELTVHRATYMELMRHIDDEAVVKRATDGLLNHLTALAMDYADGGRPLLDLGCPGGRFLGDRDPFEDDDDDWEDYPEFEDEDDEDDEDDDWTCPHPAYC